MRTIIIHVGPVQVKNFKFPSNQIGRRFTKKYYSFVQTNGEKVNRDWLVYSKTKDSVFCFVCKLFSPGVISFANEYGFRNWQNLSTCLKDHENSKDSKERNKLGGF